MKTADAYVHMILEAKRKQPYLETVFGKSRSHVKISEGEREPPVHLQNQIHNEHIRINVPLKDRDRETLGDYAGTSSRLNRALIKNHTDGTDLDSDDHDHLNELDSAVRKHRVSREFPVYSGLGFSPTKFFDKNSVERDRNFHLPAFTSASTSLDVATQFAHSNNIKSHEEENGVKPDENGETRHILKLTVPKETHAVSMVPHSFESSENEILIHRGYNASVHSVPEVYKHSDGNVYHIWHGTLLNHAPKSL